MPKYFVIPQGNTALLEGEEYRHVAVTLRAKPGDVIEVTDGDGWDYSAVIKSIDKHSVFLELDGKRPSEGESCLKVTLLQGFPKGDRSEYIIQKTVELGVHKIVFFLSDHSVVRLDESDRKRKLERFRKIAHSAAVQSGRGNVPEICIVSSADEAVKNAENLIFPYEKETERELRAALRSVKEKNAGNLTYIIGPEGGFSEREADVIEAAGGYPVTLGKRILRTDTAAPAVMAIIMYELDGF